MAKLDDILGGLIVPDDGNFSVDLARYVLQMRFSEERAALYESLSEKSQTAALTESEREELEAFVNGTLR